MIRATAAEAIATGESEFLSLEEEEEEDEEGARRAAIAASIGLALLLLLLLLLLDPALLEDLNRFAAFSVTPYGVTMPAAARAAATTDDDEEEVVADAVVDADECPAILLARP